MSDKDNFDIPEDEFYDAALDENFEYEEDMLHNNYDDEDVLVSEFDEGSEEEWLDEAPAPEAKQKKKFKVGLNFNTIVILAAVVLGGFVMMSQVNKATNKPVYNQKKTEKITTALKMEGAFEGPGAVQSEANSATEQNSQDKTNEGFMFNVDTLNNSANVDNAPPMPSPITTEGEAVKSENMSQEMNPDANINPDIVFTQGEDPVIQAQKNPVPNGPDDFDKAVQQEPAQKATAAEAKDIFGEEMPVEEKTATDNTIDKMMDAAIPEKVEEAIETAVDKVKEIVPEPVKELVQADPAPAKKIAGTDEKLDLILQRLDQMQSRISDLEESSATPQDIKTTNKTTQNSEPQIEETPVKKEPVKTAAPKKPAATKTATQNNWQLRAAQPGKAWVAKKGDNNMRPIVVGDNLTGIGRIQDIRFTNGKWVVLGSAGKITQ